MKNIFKVLLFLGIAVVGTSVFAVAHADCYLVSPGPPCNQTGYFPGIPYVSCSEGSPISPYYSPTCTPNSPPSCGGYLKTGGDPNKAGDYLCAYGPDNETPVSCTLEPDANCGGGGPSGTINVTSENSVVTSTKVSSQWVFSGLVDPCNGSQLACSGQQQTYPNQPLGQYALNVNGTPPTGYAFNSIQKHEAIAENPIVHFFKYLFNEARAVNICGFLNVLPCNPGNVIPLLNSGDTANFIILWDPIANLNVSQATVSLSNGTPQTITVGNNGVQGSTLTWTSSIAYGGTPGWLTVTPPADASGLSVGSSDSVVFKAKTAGLPNGIYKATATLAGISSNVVPPKSLLPVSISVTLTVGGGGPPVIIVSVAPSSTVPVTTSITATCTGGSGSYVWSASGPAIFSSNTSSTFTLTYDIPSSPTYTVTCTDANDGTNFDSVPEVVTQLTPVCSFVANPSQIVLPGSSVLSWSCNANAVSCYIDNPGNSVSVPTGTQSKSPVSNTTYTLTCQGPGGGPGSSSNVQTTIRVVGPGVIEYNP